VAVGNAVAPGSELLALVPFNVWVTANFKETQLGLMRAGQPVDIKVDAYPDIGFHGHVDSIQRGAGQAFAVLPAQNATGNFVKVVQRVPVKIIIDGPRDALLRLGPGMSVMPRVHVR
jgi:membrane fusion protein (multidrug efflux system)